MRWYYVLSAPRICSLGTFTSYLNASVGWIAPNLASGQRLLYKTVDGALDWRRIGKLPTAKVDTFEFLTRSAEFVVSNGVLYRTLNGGATWHAIDAQLVS
jgi:photosystem II stability/assembly factor-like uncharacterized protein